jgi:hypothetical protein
MKIYDLEAFELVENENKFGGVATAAHAATSAGPGYAAAGGIAVSTGPNTSADVKTSTVAIQTAATLTSYGNATADAQAKDKNETSRSIHTSASFYVGNP